MKAHFSKFLISWFFLINIIFTVFRIQIVKSDWVWTETIYIREDGSVYPITAPISTVDNITYTLTDNIVGNVSRETSLIIVERDNISLNGQGRSLQGTDPYMLVEWWSVGLDVNAENVTIKNFTITKFFVAINLHSSSNNTISGNRIIDNHNGIEGDSSSNNTISENNFIENWGGIMLGSISHTKIVGNNAINNVYGISVWGISNSDILGNNLTTNENGGIAVWLSNNNTISRNKFYDDGLIIDPIPSNIVVDNWVNRRPLVCLNNVSDYSVEDAGQVILHKCNNIKIENLNISKTITGIALYQTNNSRITGNYLKSNHADGIRIWHSSNNTIIKNHIESSDWRARYYFYKAEYLLP
ncbi:MAG: NosD domain-containing protein [Candidatus Bathyarchaeota archaeon]